MKRILLGNGIVGLSAAFGLCRTAASGDTIVIVGKKSRPGAATLAAAAMLNSFAEIEVGGLEHAVDRFRFEISREATKLWPQFEKDLIAAASIDFDIGGGPSGGGELGTFIINNTAADDLDDANFDAIRDALVDFGEAHQLVAPGDIPNYKPHQRYRATRALYIENEGWYNPRLVLAALERALELSGRVQFVDASVVRLEANAGGIACAHLDDGTVLSGDQFLLATGATSWDVLDRSNLDLQVQRVFYGIGTSIEIRSPDAPLSKVVRTPNRGLACGVYAAPYFHGRDQDNDRVLIGASNFIAPTLHLHGRLTSVEGLLNSAMRQINADYYRAELIRVNVGARPTSQDTYPLLGPTEISNLFIATGTKRDGFHLAPLISVLVSRLMTSGAVEDRYSWFRPDREPLRTLTRQQAVDKAVRHQISAAYQHGFEPATNRMPEQLAQQFRDNVERLHDQVGARDWGIPPEMLDMYRYGHAKA